jgi:large subunit ribosomal protein L24
MMRIKKNDQVYVITGKDRGKKGTVLAIDYKYNKVLVAGVAVVKRHKKPRKQGVPGEIRKEESYIDLSNVMPLCPKSQKPCRVSFKRLENGKKVRISQRSKEIIGG